MSQSVCRKNRFSRFAACVHVVIGPRDVLVAEQVADANKVARALGELRRQAVMPEIVRADLEGALDVDRNEHLVGDTP